MLIKHADRIKLRILDANSQQLASTSRGVLQGQGQHDDINNSGRDNSVEFLKPSLPDMRKTRSNKPLEKENEEKLVVKEIATTKVNRGKNSMTSRFN